MGKVHWAGLRRVVHWGLTNREGALGGLRRVVHSGLTNGVGAI